MTARIGSCITATVLLCASAALADTPTKAPARKISTTDAVNRSVTKIDVRAPLSAIFDQLGALAGVKIVPDWTVLHQTGVTPDRRVVLKGSRVPVGELLDMALAQVETAKAPLAWFVQGDTVRVTARSALRLSSPTGRTATSVKAGTVPPRSAVRRRRLRWDFDNVALGDVLEAFRQDAGANLYVNWRSLEQVGISKDTPITLNVDNVPWQRAIEMVVDQVSDSKSKLDRVYCILDDRVWVIATGSTLNTRTITRTFYVADMLTVVPQFTGPRLGLQNSGHNSVNTAGGVTVIGADAGTAQTTLNTGPTRQENQQRLVNFFKNAIGEEMWHPQGPGSISILRNQLVISQTRLGWYLLGRSLSGR